MMTRFAVCGVLLAAVAPAAEPPWPPSAAETAIMLQPERLYWRPALPGLPSSVKFAALEGNPSEAGPFTIRLTLPGGVSIPTHSHPWPTRMIVLSGRLALGLDPRELGTGGFWACPADVWQSLVAREDSVVQISGEGAWAIKYLKADDDPRAAGGSPK
jgi:hypothetical protein